MDRGDWWAIVYRVAKSQTRLSAHTHSDHQDDEETNSQVFLFFITLARQLNSSEGQDDYFF